MYATGTHGANVRENAKFHATPQAPPTGFHEDGDFQIRPKSSAFDIFHAAPGTAHLNPPRGY